MSIQCTQVPRYILTKLVFMIVDRIFQQRLFHVSEASYDVVYVDSNTASIFRSYANDVLKLWVYDWS